MGMKRVLTGGELAYITALLKQANESARISSLPSARVEAMLDGGMGSLRFTSGASPRRRRRAIAVDEFIDGDGTPVSVELTVDQFDDLYELDVFKADFSPLIRWPT
jgi:hypothetical protein